MKKCILIGVFVLVLIAEAAGCFDGGDVGATFDWGDGYYWNSSSHQVEKTPW